jgi:hypothetical protein
MMTALRYIIDCALAVAAIGMIVFYVMYGDVISRRMTRWVNHKFGL